MSLGLSYVAAQLKRQGRQVKIYNCDDNGAYADQAQLFENSTEYKANVNNSPVYQEILFISLNLDSRLMSFGS